MYAIIEYDEMPDEWVRVRLGGVPIRDFNAIVDAYNEAAFRYMPEPIGALCDAFAPMLDSWSYPEPPDGDGLRSRDVNHLFALVRDWVKEVRNVPLPLRRRPSDTEPSESESPSNSTEPSSTTTS
jgi:hypothetical protein